MKRGTIVAIVGLGILIVAAVVIAVFISKPPPKTITVVQWANSHPMHEGLLPDMAEQFNKEGHTTASGDKIKVEVVQVDSAAQVEDLAKRVTGEGMLNPDLKDPTIITPQAEHWLVSLNDAAGKEVVDAKSSPSIAKTVLGIMTYRDMAECLGWPQKQIGYADIIALREDPRGWASKDCAQTEWGQVPKLVFTNPRTSTSGRSTLLTLYAMASGKTPEQLTPADVTNPVNQAKVTHFASLLDHYFPTTTAANTKVYEGPKGGHFFFMPEDNLIRLYKGQEKANVNGEESDPGPIKEPMVMIYPKEGSAVHSHPAALVHANWVDDNHANAAQQWINYLRDDDRQRTFMKAGFRPGTDLPLTAPITSRFGVDPAQPKKPLDLTAVDPAVVAQVVNSWVNVKPPAVVTFVVDTSGSMKGERLDQAKTGLLAVIDNMSDNVDAGLVTFSESVHPLVEPKPRNDARFEIGKAVDEMSADGSTNLYDAIAMGISLSDDAPAKDDARRYVVVLSDGAATAREDKKPQLGLDQLVTMATQDETSVTTLRCIDVCLNAVDARGRQVPVTAVKGTRLNVPTKHPVQVFFIGVGEANLQVGRIVAEATGAEYKGTAEEDLAKAIGEFGDYF